MIKLNPLEWYQENNKMVAKYTNMKFEIRHTFSFNPKKELTSDFIIKINDKDYVRNERLLESAKQYCQEVAQREFDVFLDNKTDYSSLKRI